MSARGKRIVVALTGGIAAYKGVEVVRELQRRGASVRVVMSQSATRFVGAITLTGLTGTPAVVDLWDPSRPGEVHVELGEWADAMLIAPCTMNVLAKLASGHADDAVTATAACVECPVLLAPAMHTRMWSRASTRRNVAALAADGYHFVGPVNGPLASGAVGMGRMAEPADIASAVDALFVARDLAGLRVLVTAGPTVEDLDPVRFLGNRSTGKMGYALAERAVARGADVTLVSGPVSLEPPVGARVVKVRSALDMQAAVEAAVPDVDAVIMSAAVADYRPKEVSAVKVKKSGDVTLELVRNPDILLGLGTRRTGATPVLVGFALETNDVEAYARGKLTAKRVDLIVANEARDGFGGDDNLALFVSHAGTDTLPRMSKRDLSDRILDRVQELHTRAKPE